MSPATILFRAGAAAVLAAPIALASVVTVAAAGVARAEDSRREADRREAVRVATTPALVPSRPAAAREAVAAA